MYLKKCYDDEKEESTAYRVRLLRQDRGWSQKELADKIFVTHSQISRLESGETTNVGSSLLVSLASVFQVSTDYLLCLTPISSQKSYDISQLGLSEEVIRRLLSRRINPDIVNRLLEHNQFPTLCVLIQNYFYDITANGIMSRNAIIDLAIEPLLALKESNPPNKSALTEQINVLKASKIQKNEADIEKIKNLLLKILRDIKAEMTEQQLPGPVATAEAVAGIRAALPGKPDSALTLQDVTTAVTSFVGTQIPMDSGMEKQIEQLTTSLLQATSKNAAIE